MRDLTREQALEILEADYGTDHALIRLPHYPLILPQSLWHGGEHGANSGVKNASTLANVFNLRGKLYPDLDADGRIGHVPLMRCVLILGIGEKTANGDADVAELYAGRTLSGVGGEREANESFVYGWMKERVVVWLFESRFVIYRHRYIGCIRCVCFGRMKGREKAEDEAEKQRIMRM